MGLIVRVQKIFKSLCSLHAFVFCFAPSGLPLLAAPILCSPRSEAATTVHGIVGSKHEHLLRHWLRRYLFSLQTLTLVIDRHPSTTWAPCRASAVAVAFPMPALPPVTTQTRPSISSLAGCCLCFPAGLFYSTVLPNERRMYASIDRTRHTIGDLSINAGEQTLGSTAY